MSRHGRFDTRPHIMSEWDEIQCEIPSKYDTERWEIQFADDCMLLISWHAGPIQSLKQNTRIRVTKEKQQRNTQERKRWNDNAQTRPAPELRNVINLPVFASSPDLLIETSSRLSKKKRNMNIQFKNPFQYEMFSHLFSVLCCVYIIILIIELLFSPFLQVRQT